MNQRILFIANDRDGCFQYRTNIPYQFLKDHIKYCNLELNPISEITSKYFNYDVFIFQRPHTPYLYTNFFKWCRLNKKKIIIDIDDNLFQIPSCNPAYNFWTPDVLQNLKENLEIADAITCSTIPLYHYLSTIISNPNKITIIPNMLVDVLPYKENNDNDKIKIGWSGSPSHFGDFSNELILELKRLVEKNIIDFEIFGIVPDFLKGIATEIPWVNVEHYMTTLYNLNWDIGLIVCKDNPLNESKSNLKYLEYSACSIVSIADNVYPYTTSINKDCGIIIEKQTDWKKQIGMLIKNKEKINEYKQSAYNNVNYHYTFVHQHQSFYRLWWNVLARL